MIIFEVSSLFLEKEKKSVVGLKSSSHEYVVRGRARLRACHLCFISWCNTMISLEHHMNPDVGDVICSWCSPT